MTSPIAPPDWTLADVRERAASWAGGHAVTRAFLAVAVLAGLGALAGLRVGGDPDGTSVGPALSDLITGFVLGAGLGLALGHVTAAGRRYAHHVMSLPSLARSVLGPVAPRDAAVAVATGVAIGLAPNTLAALVTGTSTLLLLPTGPGVALVRALDRALDAIVTETGRRPRTPRATAPIVALTAALVVVVAGLRVLWADPTVCAAGPLGVPCGSTGAALLAVGAAIGTWAWLPLGAAVAASIEASRRPGPGTDLLEPVAAGAASPEAALDQSDLDGLVALVRGRFADLSDTTRGEVVTLVSRSLGSQAEVASGGDVLDVLEDAVRTAGPTQAVASITALRGHVRSIARLRAQYQRTPRLARGAVEKTAATVVRAAGVPRDVADPAVRTLLGMPEPDWDIVTGTLDEVASRFAPTAT